MRTATTLYWIVCKDLVSEYRARQVWPAMLMLGALVTFLFSAQLDAVVEGKTRMLALQVWLAIYFAGVLVLHRTFTAEHEDGCWDALRLYPINPAGIYLAKFTVNFLALAALQTVVLTLCVLLSNVPLQNYPWHMAAVAVLGNIGISSVGTLLGGLWSCNRQDVSLLACLALPLVTPVILAASEATRLVADGQIGPEWWRWIGLLSVFGVVFVTAGIVLFDFLIED
jgi:heme exporter protein B